MGWNNHARKVRDVTRSLGARYKSLGSCVLGFSWLTHGSYNAIWRRLIARHPSLARSSAPWKTFSSDDLVAYLGSLEEERREFLARIDAFRRKRVVEKRRGRRQPSKADVDALFAAGEGERADERRRG